MRAGIDHIRRRWLSLWDGHVRSLAFDAVVAACVASLLLYDTGSTSPTPLRFLAGGAVAAGLLLRRRLPIVSALLTVLASFSAPEVPASMIVVYTAASRHNRAVIVAVASLITVGLGVTSAERAAQTFDVTEALVLAGVVLTLHLTCGQEGLALRVRNAVGAGHSTVPGSGYGLLGMRERVRLAGGTLRTGSTEDGGFQVQAWFPVWREEVGEAV